MGSYWGYIMLGQFMNGIAAGLRSSYYARRCCRYDNYYAYHMTPGYYGCYFPADSYYSPRYSADYYDRSYYSRSSRCYDYFEYSRPYYDDYGSYSYEYSSPSYGGGYYTNGYSSGYDRYSRYSNNSTQYTTTQQISHKNGTSRPPAGMKLGREFLEAVKGVAERLNCDYGDLLAVMNGESGLNPAAQNKNGGATGLIQFMPSTAERLGTTTAALKQMSAMEQLPYVEELLKRCKKMAGFAENERLTGGDLYALVFLPARAKREVLCERGESGNKYYEYNEATDLNHDGKITKSELQQRVENKRVDESIFQ